MGIIIKAEAIAGAAIDQTARDLIRVATAMDVTLMCEFNGVQLMACPGDSAELLVADWKKEMGSKMQYRIARGKP